MKTDNCIDACFNAIMYKLFLSGNDLSEMSENLFIVACDTALKFEYVPGGGGYTVWLKDNSAGSIHSVLPPDQAKSILIRKLGIDMRAALVKEADIQLQIKHLTAMVKNTLKTDTQETK